MSHTPYVLANQAGLGPPSTRTSFTSVSTRSPPKTTKPFTAPAHKHAHHLHSIPRREKSTRTLIIDHMLWVHGRTRFAQGRAELGMTDRTGGPLSSNYVHRQRPENYEEDEEEPSDGEDVHGLRARPSVLNSLHGKIDEERTRREDLSLARSLRLRAESLEKVVTSMLDQPPAILPRMDEDAQTTSTSARTQHPHKLPNGVRLRLALGTVVSDLFARTDCFPPLYHRMERVSNSDDALLQEYASRNLTRPMSEGFAPSAVMALPPALRQLSTISAMAQSTLAVEQNSFITLPSTTVGTSGYPNFTVRAVSTLSPHSRALYAAGATQNVIHSMPLLRCPRHLHIACEICVDARRNSAMNARRGRTDSFSIGTGQRGGHVALGGGGITGWRDGSGIGSGLARPGICGSVLRRAPSNGGGSMTTSLLELIPRFLRLSALVAIELGNEASQEGVADGGYSSEDSNEEKGSEDTPLRNWQPSSLSNRGGKQSQNRLSADALRPSIEWNMLFVGLLTRAVLEGYITAGWRGPEAAECLFSVGLRMSGLDGNREEKENGMQNERRRPCDNTSELGNQFEEFDPDGLPSLEDASKILFPTLRASPSQRKDGTDVEYETEMNTRLQKFFDVAASTPDLLTHMEDLAQKYPAEPVERAAVRFCEAIAKWRGKPELETYKKKPSSSTQSNAAVTAGNTAVGIESFIHSNPTSPVTGNLPSRRPNIGEASMRKPPIEKYFIQVPALGDNGSRKKKRTRSLNDGRGGTAKRPPG